VRPHCPDLSSPAQTALDDERALRVAREEERRRLADERMAAAMAALHGTDLARDMREQEMLRMQMQVSGSDIKGPRAPQGPRVALPLQACTAFQLA
jgi:hypothetical protein